MKKTVLILMVMSGLLAGCASDPAPFEQMKLTEEAIAQAKTTGVPSTMDDMQLAQTKWAQAKEMMQKKNYKQARVLAEEADLDVRLAQSRWLLQKNQEDIRALQGRVDRLHQQLGDE